MKNLFYKYIYQILLFVSYRFNNHYISRYKLYIGTALLLSTSGCQEVKKKNKEEEKEEIQLSDTLHIEKQSEDSIACYITTEAQEIPRKRKKQTIENEVEKVIVEYVPPIIEEEIDITCYDGVIVCYAGGDEMPQFPGGRKQLMEYITSNIKYPQNCIEDEIQGRVIVQFTVNKGGYATNPKVLLSPSPLFDDEVARVIKQMPRWKPGRVYSKPVKINFIIPITFKIIP